MTLFHTQFQSIVQLYEYGDYNALIKRIIDLTLDTEDTVFYRKTVDLLDWIDQDKRQISDLAVKCKTLMDELYNCLSQKSIAEKSVLLEVKNLTKAYSNSSIFSLGPINLEISEGEIIGLVGENGNGKTTLLRSLCLELEATTGEISYKFEYADRYDLRTKLIYIPQRTKDWHGSLLSNLQFTAASYGIVGEENVLLVELVIARMGLRQYRAFNWSGLSSGYKMRFELARMLLRKPKLLLIDEPLANLDIVAQQVILDDFRDIAKSPFRPLGILLSSQQLYEVEKTSDKVIFLKNGVPESNNQQSANIEQNLIIEFESEWNLEQLNKIFAILSAEKVQLKGGTYIAVFPANVTQMDFMKTVIEHEVPIIYFRNISNSTRRFFL